ncbi:hypothetical protein LTR97_006694 [Elasticomyces elasticus]|uniref:Uncharacterized protein n=1 Tax=Elasticomyces elasticus TaxID=574655 RepID=A0AAN7W558_9PEZI|nr:hypothetical protein LTR97_006694 [Elasticomyces elasticus]
MDDYRAAAHMQVNTVQANTRAYDRTFWERMPLVLDTSHRLHAVMGIPPGTQMTTGHEVSGSWHTTELRPQFENFENLSLPRELGEHGGLPGVYVTESDHDDTESDSVDDAEYEEDDSTQNAGSTEPDVPTIRVQPPSAGRSEFEPSVPIDLSHRKRRPSDLPRPQLRQAHKRQKVEAEIIDLTSLVQDVATEQLRATSLQKHALDEASTAAPLMVESMLEPNLIPAQVQAQIEVEADQESNSEPVHEWNND